MESPDIDTAEFLRQRDEISEKRDEFMCKYLRRAWPVRWVCILGIVQLAISLAMLGVDLPIILMFAPRWQVFAGCWAFMFALVAAASTLHSRKSLSIQTNDRYTLLSFDFSSIVRKLTWSKLQWAVGLNVLGGLAAAMMIAFNVVFAVNPKTCVISGGCNYLSYTYTKAPSFYAGEIVLGIAFMISGLIHLPSFDCHVYIPDTLLPSSLRLSDLVYQVWCRWYSSFCQHPGRILNVGLREHDFIEWT